MIAEQDERSGLEPERSRTPCCESDQDLDLTTIAASLAAPLDDPSESTEIARNDSTNKIP